MATSLPSLHKRTRNLQLKNISENKEELQIIWLDININDSEDSVRTQLMLLELNPSTQFYTDPILCVDFIKSIENEKIFLVVSGSFSLTILPQIHHYRLLAALFIFCGNRNEHTSVPDKFEKIIGIYTSQKYLLEAIRETMHLVGKQTLAFAMFDQKQKTMRNLSNDSSAFIWYYQLVEVLKQMPQDAKSKSDMLELCTDYYRNSKREQKKIEQFRSDYSCEKAIEWYTDECFLYKLLNKALRTEDIDLLYSFRHVIIDLCTGIERESRKRKGKDVLTVYRGQKMTRDELEKLQRNVGNTILTNGFFSTSRDIKTSLRFAQQGPASDTMRPILFVIQANPSLKTTIFADVSEKSKMKNEKEVLFSLNALFKIVAIRFDAKLSVWLVDMETSDECSKEVQEFAKVMKRDLTECSATLYFGDLLQDALGQTKRGEQYYRMLLKTLPEDHTDMASIYGRIGSIHFEKQDLTLALQYYERAYKIRQQRLAEDHIQMAYSLMCFGNVHILKTEYDEALSYYKRALTICKKNYPGDHSTKAEVITMFGVIYRRRQKFDLAVSYFNRALAMYQRLFPAQHPAIAGCLTSIAFVYSDQDDLDRALEYLYRGFKMDKQIYLPDHPCLVKDIRFIVDIYKKMGDTATVLKFCLEELAQQKVLLGYYHLHIAHTLMIIGGIFEFVDLNKALKFYDEAMNVIEHLSSIDYEALIACYVERTKVYIKHKNYDDAMLYSIKSLELRRKISSSDHPSIPLYLFNMGRLAYNLNDVPQAQQYLAESLTVSEAIFKPAHELIRLARRDIVQISEGRSLFEYPVPPSFTYHKLEPGAEAIKQQNTSDNKCSLFNNNSDDVLSHSEPLSPSDIKLSATIELSEPEQIPVKRVQASNIKRRSIKRTACIVQ